ncbi:hypothetical protein ACB092_01G419400 [Castanea dentata]
MHKHISFSIFPIPCHHPSCIYSTHPSWCLLIITCWCINHNQIPFCFINFTRQTFQGKLTHRVSRITKCCALRSPANFHEVIGLIHLAIISDMIGLEHGKPASDLLYPCLIFFEENSPATIVEYTPH